MVFFFFMARQTWAIHTTYHFKQSATSCEHLQVIFKWYSSRAVFRVARAPVESKMYEKQTKPFTFTFPILSTPAARSDTILVCPVWNIKKLITLFQLLHSKYIIPSKFHLQLKFPTKTKTEQFSWLNEKQKKLVIFCEFVAQSLLLGWGKSTIKVNIWIKVQ